MSSNKYTVIGCRIDKDSGLPQFCLQSTCGTITTSLWNSNCPVKTDEACQYLNKVSPPCHFKTADWKKSIDHWHLPYTIDHQKETCNCFWGQK